MLNVVKVEEALKTLALNNRFRINAHQVAFLSQNVDVNQVYKYLLTKEPFVLKKRVEVLCPFRQDSAKVYSSVDEIDEKWIECRVCGGEFIPDKDLIFINFDFTNDYIKQLNQEVENEKKQNHPLMVFN